MGRKKWINNFLLLVKGLGVKVVKEEMKKYGLGNEDLDPKVQLRINEKCGEIMEFQDKYGDLKDEIDKIYITKAAM